MKRIIEIGNEDLINDDFVENILGLKKNGDSIRITRKDISIMSAKTYFEIEDIKSDRSDKKNKEMKMAKDCKPIDRKPIILGKNAIALIQIFEKDDNLLDISIGALENFMNAEDVKDSAKQFVEQIKDVSSPRFLRELAKEIEGLLTKWNLEEIL